MSDSQQSHDPKLTRLTAARAALRCRARSKRSGVRCKGPAVSGCLVCRFHGARAGAPLGEANGNYRHGHRAKKVIEAQQAAKRQLHETRAALEEIARRQSPFPAEDRIALKRDDE